jgi:FkbM family methyltransferase
MANTDPQEVEQRLWRGWNGKFGLDVGARRGESIEDFLNCNFTKIVCFEPSEVAYSTLARKSTFRRDVSTELIIQTYQLAVSDHDGTVHLYGVPKAMDKGELVSAIDGMEWSVSDWTTAWVVTVGCTSLDSFCARRNQMPDLVKVDTEGHEGLVLEGATTLLEHGCGWIIEFHSPTNYAYCKSRLEIYGYEVETIRHPHYAPESPMWYQHGWIRAEKVMNYRNEE